MKCPDCEGSGNMMAFFALRKNGRCDPCREIPCIRCGGSGMVPDEMMAWMAAGKAMREDRKSRNVLLRAEAKNRMMKSSELAAMEQGRIKPSPAYS